MPTFERTPVPHARCPDSVAFAFTELVLPFAHECVFDCLRNLGCLVHWWPGARGILAVPPGVYSAGDVALLQLERGSLVVRVIAYKPGRRIVLSLQQERRHWLVDLRVRALGERCALRMTFEAPREANWLSYTLQGLRLRALCRNAAEQLAHHLRNSPVVVGPLRSTLTLEA